MLFTRIVLVAVFATNVVLVSVVLMQTRRMAQVAAQQDSPPPGILVFIDESADMWKLRELVGSSHRHLHDAQIQVYAALQSDDDYEEISSWRNVHVHHMGLFFFSRVKNDFKIINECDLVSRLSSSPAVHIPLGLKFARHTRPSALPQGCNRDKVELLQQQFGLEVAKKEKSDTHQCSMSMCWLQHRHNLIELPGHVREQVSRFYSPGHEAAAASWAGKRVALLIPTYNKHGEHTVFLTDVLLPSLNATLQSTELDTFLITIYIGYDNNDPITSVNFDKLLPHRNVLVKLHRLPAVRWATAMWNMLYHDALTDGNDYFMQLGDDIQFNTPGWLHAMTAELDRMGGVGLVGPADTRWACRIMTQVMVTRRHYDIFGWFYPPEIKDWFSDNWIQTAYHNVKRTACLKRFTVTNQSGLKERYDACDNVDIANLALRKHLPKLVHYVKNK